MNSLVMDRTEGCVMEKNSRNRITAEGKLLWKNRYDGKGRLVETSDALDGAGRTVRYFYQKGGRLEKAVYPDGRQVNYEYDRLGRVRSRTDGQGYRLDYGYDCMGRLISITGSDGQKKTYTYDAAGNVTSMADAGGNTTFYEYTLSGRLKAVTDALGSRTEYDYDNGNRLVRVCRKGQAGEEDRETFYDRNPLGQVECIRDALGGEEHYAYDALGRMILKTDRDGYRTAYGYEPDGKVKSILYGDGTGVEMEYTVLRQLSAVRDWLGETRMERDVFGKPVAVTDHKGRTVSYEWGSMGERKSVAYPDGAKVSYCYDGLLRLEKMGIEGSGRTGMPEEILYRYDGKGRLAEKEFPGGMRTLWHYDGYGRLEELVHEDRDGMLDRFRYEYDMEGNKTAIRKERRGLPAENGRYEYGYDPLGRLTGVLKNGHPVRGYTYDSFGNRSGMEDLNGGKTLSYSYDMLDRLVRVEGRETGDEMLSGIFMKKEYFYDGRGNMIREESAGNLLHGYEYSAMNRLAKAWDTNGQEVFYRYNGMGQRTGKEAGKVSEEYILDLIRSYHNLLGMEKNGRKQDFYADWNITAMEETERASDGGRPAFQGLHCYLQDELGSPLRVSGYRAGRGIHGCRYLTYGYDEFGNDAGKELEDAGIPNPYDWQGVEQPFGYTGYRYDGIGGTYFAQAREYRPGDGRFMAEDVVKGNVNLPQTLNPYIYCRNKPNVMVDLNGKEEEYVAAIYLLNEGTSIGKSDNGPAGKGGAFGNGHAALMLVMDNGEGYLATQVDGMGNIDTVNVESFLFLEKIMTDSVEEKKKNHLVDHYSHGIYIPITDEEGKAMYKAAMDIRNNPGTYQMLFHNCNQVAQTILAAGGKDFAPNEFDMFDTRPDAVYNGIVEKLLEEPRQGGLEGWEYGNLQELGLNIYGPPVWIEIMRDQLIKSIQYINRIEGGCP